MLTNDNILKSLNSAIDYFSERVSVYLVPGKYPSGKDPYRPEYKPIQETKVKGNPKVSGNEISQTVSYGSNYAPYAPAYEFGSGEHAITNPGKYIIKGKKDVRVVTFPRMRGKRRSVRVEKGLAVGAGPQQRGRGGWFPSSIINVKRSPKFLAMGGKDVYLFSFVEHPGISARPFLEPVWLLEQQNITNMVGQELFGVITVELREL